jgi:Flp pilus assembly protein TadG
MSNRKKRRGAAVVEMAVVSPLLVVMLFGIIEFGWIMAVQNTLVNATREGARAGVLQGYDADDIEDRVTEYLTPMNLQEKVSISVTEATEADPVVTVSVRVPRADVSLLGHFFNFVHGELTAACSMRKEGV